MRVDVAIAGGGLAGLTAAVALSDRGLRVAVFEREPILGGRARSWADPVTGDPVHIGPHIFLSAYRNMWKLLDRLGTRDRIVWQDDRFITMLDGHDEVVIRESRLPPPYHFVPSLLRDPALGLLDVWSNWPVSQFALVMDDADVRRVDAVNGLAFLRAMGVAPRMIDRFWRFICLAITNLPLELVSAGALMRFYRWLVGTRGLKVGFPNGGLGDVFLPEAQQRIESNGGVVHTGVEVRAIDGDPLQASALVLADGTRIEARHVIAALPPTAFRRLAQPSWLVTDPALRELVHFQADPYVCVYLWFDRRLTRQRFWARAWAANDLNLDFYDYANILTDRQRSGSFIASNIIWCLRAQEMSDDEIVAATVRELSENVPDAAHAKLEHAVVNRVPMAIHCPFPGTEQRRPKNRTGVQGLLLAGDWTDTGLPCTMESACRSGWLAAEAVLGDVGRPEALAVEAPLPEGLARAYGVVLRHLPTWRSARWTRRLG